MFKSLKKQEDELKYFKNNGIEGKVTFNFCNCSSLFIFQEIFILTRDYAGSLSGILEVFKLNRLNLTYIEPKLLNKKGQ